MTFQELLARLAAAKTDDVRAWVVTENLLEQMPADLRTITWAAAIPHWFDADILAALRPELKDRAAQLYADLQKIPFVEVFPERGHNLHELTRRLMLEHLWRDNPDEFRALSARAASYFSKLGEDQTRKSRVVKWFMRVLLRFTGRETSTSQKAFSSPATLIEFIYHLLVGKSDEGANALWTLGAALNDAFRFAELDIMADVALEHANAGRLIGRGKGLAHFFKGLNEKRVYRNDRALEEFQKAQDNTGTDNQLLANVLKAMGDVQQFRDERDTALQNYAQALELFRAVGSKLGEANVLKAMGDVQQFRDERDTALQNYAQALELFRAVGDRLGEANVESALIRFELVQTKDIVSAERKLNEIVDKRRAIQGLFSEGADYFNFAVTLVTLQEWERARIYSEKARSVFAQIIEPLPTQQTFRLDEVANNLREGIILAEQGQAVRAKVFFLKAQEISNLLGELSLTRFMDELIAKEGSP